MQRERCKDQSTAKDVPRAFLVPFMYHCMMVLIFYTTGGPKILNSYQTLTAVDSRSSRGLSLLHQKDKHNHNNFFLTDDETICLESY